MEKTFAVFLDNDRIKAFEGNFNYFLKSNLRNIPENYDAYIINLSYLEFFNKGIDLDNKINNYFIFQPKSFYELIKFLKSRKVVGVVKILKKLKNIHLHFLLNCMQVKYINIVNLGFFPVENQIFSEKKMSNIYTFLNATWQNYLFRALSIFKIVPKIDAYFTSS